MHVAPPHPRPFDHVPLGLYRSTPDGQLLDVNPALVDMLGYADRAALLATRLSGLYVEEAAYQRRQALMQREGGVRGLVAQLRRQDGSLMWVRENAKAVRDAEGNVEYYEGSLEEITQLEKVSPEPREQPALAEAQIASAVRNAQTIEETQTRADQLSLLYDAGLALNSERDPRAQLELLITLAAKALNANRAEFFRYDAERQTLQPEVGIGYDELGLAALKGMTLTIEDERGVVARVARTRQPLNLADASVEPNWIAVDPALRSGLWAPVERDGQLRGVLGVLSEHPNAFSARDERLLVMFANQAAVALENARLFQAEREQRDLAETLREVGGMLASILDTDTVLDRLLEQVSRVVPNDTANVMLIEGDHVHIVRMRGYEQLGMYELGENRTAAYPMADLPNLIRMRDTREPTVIPDVQADPTWMRRGGAGLLRSYAGAPICVRGKVMGFMNVGSKTPGFFSWQHADRLLTFAHQAGIALENARLFLLVDQEKERLELLYRLSRQLAESLDVREVVQRALDGICAVVGALRGVAWVREGDVLSLVAISGYEAESLLEQYRQMPLQVGAGLAGWVADHRQLVVLNNVTQDARWSAAPGLDDWVCSALCVPLLSGDELVGVLSMYDNRAAFFNPDHLRLVESAAATVAVAITNARLYQAEREQFRRLQESQTQLIQAEKMGALGRLVSSIAHEINNPLQAVQGCLSLIREELEGERRQERVERYARLAENEIERLSNIVRRVRDFYRPARQERRPTDVQAALESVLALTGKQLQHSNITVESDWASGLPLIQANPDYVRQVFLNLIVNAIDAMSAQGGTLRVRTALDSLSHAERQIAAVRIEIGDTGVGIPPEVLPRIFEPFFTGKENGTGLGLSISYGIIEAHNGRITVESQVGQGTTFTIWLPVENIVDSG